MKHQVVKSSTPQSESAGRRSPSVTKFRRFETLTLLPAYCCILLTRGYQATLGSLMGGHCRFQPTCSTYAIEAYRRHGVFRGSWLTAGRLLRCHPFSRRCGFDPVPQSGDDPSA